MAMDGIRISRSGTAAGLAVRRSPHEVIVRGGRFIWPAPAPHRARRHQNIREGTHTYSVRVAGRGSRSDFRPPNPNPPVRIRPRRAVRRRSSYSSYLIMHMAITRPTHDRSIRVGRQSLLAGRQVVSHRLTTERVCRRDTWIIQSRS
jgi:hypothetical protein